MQHTKTLQRRWLIYAVAGLLLVGFGLSLFGEAVAAKIAQRAWFALGTAALVVFNAGLCVFGQAVVYRARLEQLHDTDKKS